MPTGSGKSVIIAELCKQVIAVVPTTRIMVITDSKEIIRQDCEEIKRHIPDIKIGIFSAGLKEKDTKKQITIAGIQSVYARVHDFYPAIDLVISDESHMISANDETRYGHFFDAIYTANPHSEIIGFTASPYRLDQGLIYGPEGCRFSDIIYDAQISRLIKDGYLVPVISKGGIKKIDLSHVHTRGGEYIPEELAFAANDPEVVRLAVSEIIEYGNDRKSWLVFAAGVMHAHAICKEFKEQGIPSCEVLTGETSPLQRDRIIQEFKDGKLRCIVNINILIKGFNHPGLDLIALLTSTKSTAKYVQAVGRILRPCEGKINGLVLDYGGNVSEHGPIDAVSPKHASKTEKEYPAPMKQCPECQAIIYASYTECPECGHKYPIHEREPNHGSRAYDGAMLKEQIPSKWLDVTDVTYSRHQKEGKPDSVKVTFSTVAGLTFPMWLAIEHGGYATTKALQYLSSVGSSTETTVDSILKVCQYYKKPKKIEVRKNGKFYDILQIDIAEDDTEQKELF